MNKQYIVSIGVVVVLFAGVLFGIQSYRAKTFSVSSEPVQTGSLETERHIQSSDEALKSGVSEQETASGSAQSEVAVVENTETLIDAPTAVAVDKNVKDTPVKEAPKAVVAKTPQISSKLDIRNTLVSFGFATPSKPRTIDTIVVHSSYDAIGDEPYAVAGVIAEWKAAGVAPHYLIARDGSVYRLVNDENIAYHAGVSTVPDGRTNVNDFSVGIEMLNTKTDTYTDAQYVSIRQLIAFLKGKYTIKYVLGHDDIAPGRKSDPWNFDWKKL